VTVSFVSYLIAMLAAKTNENDTLAPMTELEPELRQGGDHLDPHDRILDARYLFGRTFAALMYWLPKLSISYCPLFLSKRIWAATIIFPSPLPAASSVT
jgi:hypothetical protein